MNKILRLRDVVEQTGIPRSTIYARIKNGTFPRPIKLSKRSVGWPENSITDWMNNLLETDSSVGGIDYE